MGGIGKTTMYKTLCNGLSEFEGKVCHVELAASESPEKLLQKMLRTLTSTSQELLQDLEEGKWRHILRENTSWKQKTFLAVDNVWDDTKSLAQAQMFLEAAYVEGSVVLVTARSLSTLVCLKIDKSQCFEVPELGKVDARNLFLHHAAKGKQFDSNEDNHVIEVCVERCYFQKGEKLGSHYLPLALKVLGMHLGWLGNKPSDWKKSLPKVRDFNYFPEENPVFSILRLNFDRLGVQEQALFMDIALYSPPIWFECVDDYDCVFDPEQDLRRWLNLVHSQESEDTECQLQHLKEKGLLEDVDVRSQKFSMHDLYREFAVLESQGKLNSASFEDRRWVYANARRPTDLEMTPSGRCWEKLIRVYIIKPWFPSDDCLKCFSILWRYCSNVEVLRLVRSDKPKEVVSGVLNLKDLKCLRSLVLERLDELNGIEGLKYLNNLTCFRWAGSYYTNNVTGSRRSQILGQLPASLKVLHIDHVAVYLRRDVFVRCPSLCKLLLRAVHADDGLDFSNCTSLQNIELEDIPGLPMVSGLAAGLTSCLQSLSISECDDLSDVSGLDYLVGLQKLRLYGNGALETLPDLQKLTSLQVLKIMYKECFTAVPGLGSLPQLCEVSFVELDLTELPNLSGLAQLQGLELDECRKLSTLEGIGDLPALRHLYICDCESLLRLPDLRKSTNLEKLVIARSAIELQEEDIRMLAKLPMLRPVTVSSTIRLDPVRRKVLKRLSDYMGVRVVEEERDLETPPIKVRDYEF